MPICIKLLTQRVFTVALSITNCQSKVKWVDYKYHTTTFKLTLGKFKQHG